MEKLGLYYFDFTKSIGEDFSIYDYDENGIPYTLFYRSKQWQYNPVVVCQYALYVYNKFLRTNNPELKEKFLTQANWLVDNNEKGPNNSAVWYYQINDSYFNLKKPWISGMAQGEALSVLLRAYELTADKKYYSLAQKVWNIFSVHVEEGGVLSNFADGSPLIEEYPSSQVSCVLNGYLFSLFGIYDYQLFSKSEEIKLFFNKLIIGLKKNLKYYDTTYWSLYDIFKPHRLSSKCYHKIHIIQLTKLYNLTNETIFLETAEKWEKYRKNPISNIKWVISKIKQRIWMRIHKSKKNKDQ